MAGGKVFPLLEIPDQPDCFIPVDDVAHKYPDVFPASVVTRAQKRRIGTDIGLSVSFMSSVFEEGKFQSENITKVIYDDQLKDKLFDAEVLNLPMSRDEVSAAQIADPSL